jgi:hypothetical protein
MTEEKDEIKLELRDSGYTRRESENLLVTGEPYNRS